MLSSKPRPHRPRVGPPPITVMSGPIFRIGVTIEADLEAVLAGLAEAEPTRWGSPLRPAGYRNGSFGPSERACSFSLPLPPS